MKAERKEPIPFTPVTLTLETQAEVDAIHALLCHGVLLNALPKLSRDAHKELGEFIGDERESMWRAVDAAITGSRH